MMLPAQGPTSTLTEDMDHLFGPNNLTEDKGAPAAKVQQTKKSDEEGGDYAGPPSDKKPGDPGGDVDLEGDKAAGHYTYVPVRGDENVGPTGKYGSGRGGAKNEDINNKMVPAFMIPSETEVTESNEKLAEAAEKDQLTKAWEVINTYFSEDDDGLNEAGLRGIINAMGHALNVAVEDISMLSSENVRLTEAVNDLNQILKEGDDYAAGDKKKKSLPPWMKNKDDEDEDEDDGEAEGGEMGESRRTRSNLQEDDSLNSILDEVASIGGTPKQQAINAQAKLIEGFEKVMDSATDLVERIVSVIRVDEGLDENEEISLPEGDQRAEVAQFFYSIAEDSQNYLTRLTDGDVAFRVAEEDLNRLSADIQKGIEAMHHIP